MGYPYLFAQLSISPNHTRAKVALILCRVMIAVKLAGLITDFSTFRYYSTYHTLPDLAYRVIAVLRLVDTVLTIAFTISFIAWINRAYKNLHKANVEGLEFKHGWAVAAWFVPFMNLVRPYKIVKDTWNKTQEGFRKGEPFVPKSDSLVSYWWFATILSGIMVNVLIRMTNVQWELVYIFAIVCNVVYLFALSYGAKMIRRISGMETEMLERATLEYESKVSASAQQYMEHNSSENDFQPAPQQTTQQEIPKKRSYTLTGDFTENRERAKFLIFALHALIVPAFLFGGICYFISREKSGMFFYDWRPVNHWLTPLCYSGLLVLIATCILLMLWMHRAYSNLHNLDIKELAFDNHAAAYSWFIPIGNIFIPYTILNEINRETQQAIHPEKDLRKNPPNHTLLLLFWILFVLTLFFTALAYLSIGPLEIHAKNFALYGIFAAVTGIISFYLGATAVKNISALENELFVLVEAANEFVENENLVFGPHELPVKDPGDEIQYM